MAGHVVVNNLGVSFTGKDKTIWAVKDVSLEVKSREFVSLVGVSGCGKSTVINSIAGFVPPTVGEVTVDNQPITEPNSRRGVVFQSFVLFPWKTVRENIAFGPRSRDVDEKVITGSVDQYLTLMGLMKFADHYPQQLSGGMRQRVALARVLINDPDVLLMDEPFGALDAQTRIFMQEVVLNLWESTHKSVLFVTHDIDEAVFLSDRVYVMTAAPGSIKSVYNIELERPRHADIRLDQKFLYYKKELYEAIREESQKVLGPLPTF
ncbi:MAG: ABC transporter ATP-binding protein [Candidatus Thiodiazotropha endolucinida]